MRVLLADNRTLLAWIRTALASAGLGFAAAKFAAPGTRLPAPVKLPIPARLTRTLEYVYVSPNSDVFLATGANRPTWTLTGFSPRTGQLTRILGATRRTKITPLVQWASNTGHVLIISGREGGLGVLHNGRYLPLPMPRILRNPLTSAVW